MPGRELIRTMLNALQVTTDLMLADDAAMVAMAPGDRPAECFVLLSDQVSDVAGGAGRTVADAEGRSAPGESAGVVVARSPNPLCKQGVRGSSPLSSDP
jgi:hypothetical protein